MVTGGYNTWTQLNEQLAIRNLRRLMSVNDEEAASYITVFREMRDNSLDKLYQRNAWNLFASWHDDLSYNNVDDYFPVDEGRVCNALNQHYQNNPFAIHEVTVTTLTRVYQNWRNQCIASIINGKNGYRETPTEKALPSHQPHKKSRMLQMLAWGIQFQNQKAWYTFFGRPGLVIRNILTSPRTYIIGGTCACAIGGYYALKAYASSNSSQ